MFGIQRQAIMPNLAPITWKPTAEEREQMHALYRRGGEQRSVAPHVIYMGMSVGSICRPLFR